MNVLIDLNLILDEGEMVALFATPYLAAL